MGRTKLLLSGEHTVLGGACALVLPYIQGATARVELSTARAPQLYMQMQEQTPVHRPELDGAYAALLRALGKSCVVHAVLHAPPGVGLGLSAALGVAIARALAPDAPAEVVRAAAMAWDNQVHGRASGVDVAAAMGAAPLNYRMGEAPMPCRVRRWNGWFVPVVVQAAPPTSQMVARVQAWAGKQPGEWAEACHRADQRTQQMSAALARGDAETVGVHMNQAHAALEALGVSTPRMNEVAVELREAGAMGVKLTGAGGGGSLLALVPDRAMDRVALRCAQLDVRRLEPMMLEEAP